MDEKRRSKRPKIVEDGCWDCSVCTYKNSPEAFKCEMCDVRKGTSTRKPRLNAQLVAQQVAQQFTPPPNPKKESLTPPLRKEKRKDGERMDDSSEEGQSERKERKDKNSASTSGHTKKSQRPPRLKNIDRSSGQSMEVTYGDVTVVITDYKPKKERNSLSDSQASTTSTQSNTSQSTDITDSKSITKQEVNGELETEEKS